MLIPSINPGCNGMTQCSPSSCSAEPRDTGSHARAASRRLLHCQDAHLLPAAVRQRPTPHHQTSNSMSLLRLGTGLASARSHAGRGACRLPALRRHGWLDHHACRFAVSPASIPVAFLYVSSHAMPGHLLTPGPPPTPAPGSLSRRAALVVLLTAFLVTRCAGA